jgi:hypothetical protein
LQEIESALLELTEPEGRAAEASGHRELVAQV